MLENSIKYYESVLEDKKKQKIILDLQIKAVEEEVRLYKILDETFKSKDK